MSASMFEFTSFCVCDLYVFVFLLDACQNNAFYFEKKNWKRNETTYVCLHACLWYWPMCGHPCLWHQDLVLVVLIWVFDGMCVCIW